MAAARWAFTITITVLSRRPVEPVIAWPPRIPEALIKEKPLLSPRDRRAVSEEDGPDRSQITPTRSPHQHPVLEMVRTIRHNADG